MGRDGFGCRSHLTVFDLDPPRMPPSPISFPPLPLRSLVQFNCRSHHTFMTRVFNIMTRASQ